MTKTRLGLHTSTAGGLENAALEAARIGADAFQIFSASPRMWAATIPGADHVRALKRERERHGLTPLVVHGNYLINLASRDAEIRHKSLHAFRGEIARALLIGAEFLVFHPGSSKNQAVEDALQAVVAGMEEAARGLRGPLTLLIENTAGQGAALGGRLEELAEIRKRMRTEFAVGYCIDTCHSLVAGYPVASEGFVETVDDVLGWEQVPVLHTNDSKGGLGSRLDRHEHIGRGQIGEEGFAFLLNHARLRGKTFILETPEDEEGDGQRNLERLRSLIRE